ncbi:hypothetical protein DIPPA_12332 [Diplonema papillatum]|nr:hypothetical protein DIPPA_20320 [Diplonema papillatum]KAJ9453223.1 hypothetical protein DIPPA_12332 [Diplonema papillatum]
MAVRVVSQLLAEWTGCRCQSAPSATNLPESLDLSLISPGRLDLYIHMVPDCEGNGRYLVAHHYCVPAGALSSDERRS